ncbi:cellulase family glycosylhydrolase [Rhodococcoides corynebacterioides]|uniref:cellulase family glycosylhydrolase n=1 Tax=Rhodococcoides corynebacterioides TaxID=53972 RepID=UPI003F7DFE29
MLGCSRAEPDQARPPRQDTFGYAAGSTPLWSSTTDVDRMVRAAVDGGATALRFDVSWAFAEPAAGLFDWAPSDRVVDAATRAGLGLLATVTNCPAWAAIPDGPPTTSAPRDPQRYGDFVGAVADRYRGRVAAYEIWNEPNGRIFFWPDPDAVRYAALLRSAAAAVRRSDPGAVVVAGALGNTGTGDGTVDAEQFLAALYRAGVAGAFDAVSYHPYDTGVSLADGSIYPNSPMQQVIRLHELMDAHGDGAKQVWITEYGASTAVVQQDAQALALSSSLQQWQEVPYGGPFYVHTVRDIDSSSTDPEAQFGVLTDSWAPKPAYEALATLARAGVRSRTVADEFDAAAPAELGTVLGPVFSVAGTTGRQYTNGSLYRSTEGWIVSPPDVAALARAAKLAPITPFRDGYQDFDVAGGYRIFSAPTTGTHAVSGAILAAWRPELGFPVAGEIVDAEGRRVVAFEWGQVAWDPVTAESFYLPR